MTNNYAPPMFDVDQPVEQGYYNMALEFTPSPRNANVPMQHEIPIIDGVRQPISRTVKTRQAGWNNDDTTHGYTVMRRQRAPRQKTVEERAHAEEIFAHIKRTQAFASSLISE